VVAAADEAAPASVIELALASVPVVGSVKDVPDGPTVESLEEPVWPAAVTAPALLFAALADEVESALPCPPPQATNEANNEANKEPTKTPNPPFLNCISILSKFVIRGI
jgi:hypothetical protein